jgi:hypothetical protein
MSKSAGLTAYQLAFEISPITLTGGIASDMPGGMLPLMSVLQAQSFSGIQGGGDFDLDQAFARFSPLPGTQLIANAIGQYPFANLQTAANCTLALPLNISLLMRAPASTTTVSQKSSIFQAVKNTLDQHQQAGGTFTVMTLAFPFTDAILLDLTDVSGGDTHQQQVEWKWDFQKPLVSLAAAQGAYNNLMGQLASGQPTDGSASGISATVGNAANPATPAVSPAANSSASSSVPSMIGQPLPGNGYVGNGYVAPIYGIR